MSNQTPTAQSSEASLIAQRKEKADHLRARGDNPFKNQVARSERRLVSELRTQYAAAASKEDPERYDSERFASLASKQPVVVLGRLVARRGFGKLTFLRLRDRTGEIQLFVRRNVLGDDFERLADIDVGDHIEARGQVIVTKTGELSVEPTALRSVSKALRPLPEKWHGLTDVEQRYRHRYVDFVANPSAAITIRARSLIVQGIRQYLDGQDFLEVETPTLHPLVGGASARPFETQHNALDLSLFLRIAPELYLKRLLVGGFERVYEIGRCYRNEGISTRHNPEFTMLEFYEAYATYETLMDQGEQLLRHVDGFLQKGLQERGLARQAEEMRAGRKYTLAERFARIPMQKALEEGLRRAAIEPTLIERLVAQRLDRDAFEQLTHPVRASSARAGAIDWSNLGRGLAKCHGPGERLFVAYEYIAEPFLSEDYRSEDGRHSRPVFITEHPTEVSPLARCRDDDPARTERFELFVENREIGNAFSELNDPEDQAQRFRDQVELRSAGKEETMDYDEDYIRALEHGMPPAAGFGIGVDRLVMMLTGCDTIRDVIAFPLLRPKAKGA